MAERWLSVEEAAERLVVPAGAVRRWVRTRRLRHKRAGAGTLIPEAEVIALMRGERDLVFTKEWEREQDALLAEREHERELAEDDRHEPAPRVIELTAPLRPDPERWASQRDSI